MDVLNDLLFKAASANNIEDIVDLIAIVDVNVMDSEGWTPICYATYEGNIESVEMLIKHGARIDILTDDEDTLLNIAICNYQYEIVELLLDKGVDINTKDSENWTPLHYAISYWNAKIVKLLIIRGANCNMINNKEETPYDLLLRKNDSEQILYRKEEMTDIIENYMLSDQPKFAGWNPCRTPCGPAPPTEPYTVPHLRKDENPHPK